MKYRYYLEHKESGEIITNVFSEFQIYNGEAKRLNEINTDFELICISKCTGLKLKNSDEFLFEDDVFEYQKHEGYSLPSFNATVVWFEEYACFGYETINLDNKMRFITQTAFAEHDELEHDFLNHITIIGNKIENNYKKEPEILDVPKVIEKRLLIKQCNDSLMWYSHKVGQLVAFTRETATEYISIDNGGFVNIVKKKDAVIVDVEVTLKS